METLMTATLWQRYYGKPKPLPDGPLSAPMWTKAIGDTMPISLSGYSYAVFEAKQTVDANLVKYAQNKAASVRNLYRTSLSIPHAGGSYSPKKLTPIIGGLLAFESEWNPPLGASFEKVLNQGEDDRRFGYRVCCLPRTFSVRRGQGLRLG